MHTHSLVDLPIIKTDRLNVVFPIHIRFVVFHIIFAKRPAIRLHIVDTKIGEGVGLIFAISVAMLLLGEHHLFLDFLSVPVPKEESHSRKSHENDDSYYSTRNNPSGDTAAGFQGHI